MFAKMMATLRLWHDRIRTRNELAEYTKDPRLLDDLPVCRCEVYRELNKWFWQE